MKFRKNCILETSIFLMTMVAFNVTLFSYIPAYQSISPHPYLVMVVLMASLYGIREGLVACFFSIPTFILQLMIMDEKSFVSIFASPVNLKIFILLFTTAVVLGEIKEIYNRKEEELSSSLKEARDKLDKLKLKYETVKTAKDELETRIIGQSTSIISLYEATKALESLEIDKIYRALLNLIVKFIGAEKCSLYLVNETEQKLINVATFGWKEAEKARRAQINMDKGILGLVVKNRKPLTIRDIQEDSKLRKIASKNDGWPSTILCTPLKVDGKTMGAVNIEEIPLVKLTASTVRTLSMLVDLASPAIENAFIHQQAKERDIYNPVTNLIKYSYFLRRGEEELRRTIRYNLIFSLLVFEIVSFAELLGGYSKEDKTTVLKTIAKMTTSNVRCVDILSRQEQETRFILLLPLTNPQRGLVVAKRLNDKLAAAPINLKKGKVKITATFGLSGYHSGIKDIEWVINKAVQALEDAKCNNKKIGMEREG